MRHAIIILSHCEYWILKKLITYFNDNDFDLYLNIDPKLTIEPTDTVLCQSNIRKITRCGLHWGGYSLLNMEMQFLREIAFENRVNFVHLISGQDYPIKPLQKFKEYFLNNPNVNFISFMPGRFDLAYKIMAYYLPYDYLNTNRKRAQAIADKCIKFQNKLHIYRTMHKIPSDIVVGSQWFSITINATKFILSYTKRSPYFFKRLKFTFAPEEIYINNILLHFYHKEEIRNNNLRFIRWYSENGSNPSLLGNEHLRLIYATNALFARKFNDKIGLSLINEIDKNIINKNSYDKVLNYIKYNEDFSKWMIKFVGVLGISSVLLYSPSCLYLDALSTQPILINGMYHDNRLLHFADTIGLSGFYQLGDLREPMYIQENDKFDCLCIINCDHSELVSQEIIANMKRLSKHYVLIASPDYDGYLSPLENIFKENGITISSSFNKLLGNMSGLNSTPFLFCEL